MPILGKGNGCLFIIKSGMFEESRIYAVARVTALSPQCV